MKKRSGEWDASSFMNNFVLEKKRIKYMWKSRETPGIRRQCVRINTFVKSERKISCFFSIFQPYVVRYFYTILGFEFFLDVIEKEIQMIAVKLPFVLW